MRARPQEVGAHAAARPAWSCLPGVGPRLLSYCNVPDLELLPARYPTLRTVQFRAGMELRVFGYALYLLSVAAPRVDFTR